MWKIFLSVLFSLTASLHATGPEAADMEEADSIEEDDDEDVLYVEEEEDDDEDAAYSSDYEEENS